MLSRLRCTLPGGFARIRLLTGRLAKTLFSVVTAVGVLAAVAPAARADPGFDDGPPDKALHTWCYYDVVPRAWTHSWCSPLSHGSDQP